MRKLWITLGAVVVVLGVVVTLLLTNLQRVVDSQKDRILKQAEAQTGRDISVGDVGVSIWPSISVTLADVTVGDDPAFSAEPFFTAQSGAVRVRILPLLRKEVEVKRLVLDQPVVRVIKNEAGVLNTASLSNASGDASEVEAGGGDEKSAATPFALALANINNGTFYYSDRQSGQNLEAHDLDVKVSNISKTRAIDFQLDAAVLSDDDNIELVGSVGPVGDATSVEIDAAALDVTVDVKRLDIDRVLEVLPEKPGKVNLGGAIAARLSLGGTVANLTGDVSVDGTDLDLESPDKYRKPAGEPLSLVGKIKRQDDVIAIHDARLEMADLAVDVVGSFDARESVPKYTMSFTSQSVEVSKLRGYVASVDTLSASGPAKLETTVTGRLGEALPQVAGRIELQGVRVTLKELIKPVENIRGTINITDKTAFTTTEGLTARMGKSDVTTSFSVTQFEPMKLSYVVTSPELRREDVQVYQPVLPERLDLFRKVTVRGAAVVADPKNFTHNGLFTSPAGIVSGADYNILRADFKGDTKKVRIESYQLNTLGGSVTGNGEFVVAGDTPSFSVVSKVNSIDLVKFAEYRMPGLSKAIEGKISLDLTVGGKGKKWDDIQPTLAGNGTGEMLQGAFLSVNIANDLLAGLEQIQLIPRSFFANLRQRHSNVFGGNRTAFENVRGRLKIEDGRIFTSGVDMVTAGYGIKANGSLGFDQTLELDCTLSFTPEMTNSLVAQFDGVKYLRGADGRVTLPVKLVGDVKKPKVVPDIAAITNTLQKNLVSDAKDELKDKLGDVLNDKLKDGKLKDVIGGFGKKKTPPDSTR